VASDSGFVTALRALRAAAGNPTQQAIGQAIGRTHSIVGYTLRGVHTPPWDTAAAIIKALGGDPADFRAAWEAARDVPERHVQRPFVPAEPVVPGLRSLLVRHDRLGDDIRDFLAGMTPDSLFPALAPGTLAQYPLSGAGGRDVSVWHASAGCSVAGVVRDVAQALDWALGHEREVHGDGV
jgi:hypothetical protein